MGFRVRKSFNIGCGFRINLSKSGIGYSWGVKGLRFTKTARGTNRSSITIPGTGISYVEERSEKTKEKVANPQLENEFYHTENVNIDEYKPAEYSDILNSIQKIQIVNFISTLLILSFIFIFLGMYAFIITGILGIVLKVYIHKKMSIAMLYTFDEEEKEKYNKLCAVWMGLKSNRKLWRNIAAKNQDWKTNGGASRGVKRVTSTVQGKLPFYIHTNIPIICLNMRDKSIYFLPDKMLIISRLNAGAINYSELNIRLDRITFIENERVEDDAHIINYTWEKVNKNGTPDKRFKGNKKLPVCEYGLMVITAGNAFRIELMCSNVDTINKIRNAVSNYESELLK